MRFSCSATVGRAFEEVGEDESEVEGEVVAGLAGGGGGRVKEAGR